MNIRDYPHWCKRRWVEHVAERYVMKANTIFEEISRNGIMDPAVFSSEEDEVVIRFEWTDKQSHTSLLINRDETLSLYYVNVKTKEKRMSKQEREMSHMLLFLSEKYPS